MPDFTRTVPLLIDSWRPWWFSISLFLTPKARFFRTFGEFNRSSSKDLAFVLIFTGDAIVMLNSSPSLRPSKSAKAGVYPGLSYRKLSCLSSIADWILSNLGSRASTFSVSSCWVTRAGFEGKFMPESPFWNMYSSAFSSSILESSYISIASMGSTSLFCPNIFISKTHCSILAWGRLLRTPLL